MSSSSSCWTLYEFPDELIVMIAKHFHSVSDFASFSRTCKSFYNLFAEPSVAWRALTRSKYFPARPVVDYHTRANDPQFSMKRLYLAHLGHERFAEPICVFCGYRLNFEPVVPVDHGVAHPIRYPNWLGVPCCLNHQHDLVRNHPDLEVVPIKKALKALELSSQEHEAKFYTFYSRRTDFVNTNIMYYKSLLPAPNKTHVVKRDAIEIAKRIYGKDAAFTIPREYEWKAQLKRKREERRDDLLEDIGEEHRKRWTPQMFQGELVMNLKMLGFSAKTISVNQWLERVRDFVTHDTCTMSVPEATIGVSVTLFEYIHMGQDVIRTPAQLMDTMKGVVLRSRQQRHFRSPTQMARLKEKRPWSRIHQEEMSKVCRKGPQRCKCCEEYFIVPWSIELSEDLTT